MLDWGGDVRTSGAKGGFGNDQEHTRRQVRLCVHPLGESTHL